VDRVSDPKLERAEPLMALKELPQWDSLRDLAREQMDKKFASLTSRLMSPQGVGEDERQYWRGYFAGIKFLLDQPDLHEKKLKKFEAEHQTDERN